MQTPPRGAPLLRSPLSAKSTARHRDAPTNTRVEPTKKLRPTPMRRADGRPESKRETKIDLAREHRDTEELAEIRNKITVTTTHRPNIGRKSTHKASTQTTSTHEATQSAPEAPNGSVETSRIPVAQDTPSKGTPRGLQMDLRLC